MIESLLTKLNNGEHVVTYELLPVRPDRKPAMGEIRQLMPLTPSPWEPLASMVPLDPVRIIWNGAQWLEIDSL
ncbi:hypothetical protein [Bradyrhizobium sp. Tv2a-2]|uniref:hypothetical protein n=1 Tax=Bradyrhizobium sp. Tv2a-2 TaxID=113395 RepID=UPI00055CFA48|nr:hypothetical protein [Bradyrhizobium sp. Tv2a-2]